MRSMSVMHGTSDQDSSNSGNSNRGIHHPAAGWLRSFPWLASRLNSRKAKKKKKKKNNKKKVIRANFKLFHLCFATFLAKNIIFSAIF